MQHTTPYFCGYATTGFLAIRKRVRSSSSYTGRVGSGVSVDEKGRLLIPGGVCFEQKKGVVVVHNFRS